MADLEKVTTEQLQKMGKFLSLHKEKMSLHDTMVLPVNGENKDRLYIYLNRETENSYKITVLHQPKDPNYPNIRPAEAYMFDDAAKLTKKYEGFVRLDMDPSGNGKLSIKVISAKDSPLTDAAVYRRIEKLVFPIK